MSYTAIFEKGPTSWGAYVPDLPGCIAVGETLKETTQLISEAIAFHIEGLREAGLPVPKPTSRFAKVDAPTAYQRFFEKNKGVKAAIPRGAVVEFKSSGKSKVDQTPVVYAQAAKKKFPIHKTNS